MKLIDIADIHAGYPFRGRIPEIKHGSVSVVQMRDISLDGDIDWDKLVRTNIEGRRLPDLLAPGDILFVAKGTQNYAYHMQQVPEHCVASPYFYQIRVKNKPQLLSHFLAWQINQRAAQTYFAKSAEGSTTMSIRRTVLENLIIHTPTISKQKQVLDLYACFLKEKALTHALIKNREKQLLATLEKFLDLS